MQLMVFKIIISRGSVASGGQGGGCSSCG